MPEDRAPVDGIEAGPRRPAAVLFVYSWDLVLAILALFGALAPFAGGFSVGQSSVALPLVLQILAAVVSAAYAATLIMVASMLTRPVRWVLTIQVATFMLAVLLAAVSIVVDYVTGIGVETPALLVTLLFVLVDVFAIVLMTERRVVDWYKPVGRAPRYLVATLLIWAGGSGAFVISEVALRAGVK